MERDRGGRNNISEGRKEHTNPWLKLHAKLHPENPDPVKLALKMHAEHHPDEPDPITHTGKMLVKLHPHDPYIRELVRRYNEIMHRRQIRNSSDQHTPLRVGPKIVERALKHGKEIILERIRRAREIVHFKPRQQK